MSVEWYPSEVKAILKSMFLMLSDNFRVAEADITFLKEVAAMGAPFNTLDYTQEIDGYAQAYHRDPAEFMRPLLAELALPTLDERVARQLLSSCIGILEQSEKTYERLTILKCIRAQLGTGASHFPEYDSFKRIPLSLLMLDSFLERDMIDEPTLFRISNEHNDVPAVSEDPLPFKALALPTGIQKWWRRLFGPSTT